MEAFVEESDSVVYYRVVRVMFFNNEYNAQEAYLGSRKMYLDRSPFATLRLLQSLAMPVV